MKTTIAVLLSAVALLVTKGSSVPTAPGRVVLRTAGSGMPYPVGTMLWTGPPMPGSANISLNGTIQEVIKHLEDNYQFDLDVAVSAFNKREPVTARTAYRGSCDIPSQLIPGYLSVFSHDPVQDAIKYFKGLGASSCGCAGHTCCRISCSWETAIYLCNDNDYAISPRCDWQGTDMVQWVDNNCRNYPSKGNEQGKVWDTENYSDTVQGDSC